MRRQPVLLDHMPVLGDPLRGRLLLLLEGNELTVKDLCAVLQLPQPNVSRHLKVLSETGWVAADAEGTSRRYRAVDGAIDPAVRSLWLIVRKEIAASLAAKADARRLRSVLAARRSRSEEFFRSEAGKWDRLRDELFGDGFFLAALPALLDPAWTVGDLGCGTGRVSEAIAPFVARVVAVDGSDAMLRAARKRLRGFPTVEVRQGALESLPVEDGSLDAATLVLVLHHVAEPARVLAEATRALAPGGRLLVVDMLPHDREEYRRSMGHVWLGFAEEAAFRALEEAGLQDVVLRPLPTAEEAKGPSLFVARGVKPRALLKGSRYRRKESVA